MPAANFDFPMHTVQHDYPERPQVQFGGGYTFTTAPDGPPERTFVLSFESMKWVKNANNVGFSNTLEPEINILRLDEFYRAHETHTPFNYPHDVYGVLSLRFLDPFRVPKSTKGGSGMTDAFTLRLVEDLA